MKIVVIGGGVIGVASMYYLARAGHEVVLLERHGSAGTETSAGNAGLISPSDSFAWASPEALKTTLRSFVRPDLGIRLNPGLDLHFLKWSFLFLNECRLSRWRRNSEIKLGLARQSLELMGAMRLETGIDFDYNDRGIYYASRTEKSFSELQERFRILQDYGLPLEILSQSSLLEKFPALEARICSITGAVYSPTCATGDSRLFANRLAEWCCRKFGSRLLYDVEVHRIERSGDRIDALWTSEGRIEGDAFILAAGSHSVGLARSADIQLPIYPVKGFSITVPIRERQQCPDAGFDDVDNMVAMSRLGDRLRIASSAVFEGYDLVHRPGCFRSILRVAQELFPEAADYTKARYWAGLRPMTPSSVPIIGKSSIDNFYLNTGHGHLGWTLACASGKAIADAIS